MFEADKAFTVILFSVLHDVITYSSGLFIEESSVDFLVHKQYASSSANSTLWLQVILTYHHLNLMLLANPLCMQQI